MGVCGRDFRAAYCGAWENCGSRRDSSVAAHGWERSCAMRRLFPGCINKSTGRFHASKAGSFPAEAVAVCEVLHWVFWSGSLLGVSDMSSKSLISWEESIKSCVEKKGKAGSTACPTGSAGGAAEIGCLGRRARGSMTGVAFVVPTDCMVRAWKRGADSRAGGLGLDIGGGRGAVSSSSSSS